MRDDRVVGCAAVEQYGNAGLLRSVAVSKFERGSGLGTQLVKNAITHAAPRGLDTLILLTTTAELYFPRFGFRIVDRASVPQSVLQSVEFRSACPATATVMRLDLEEPLDQERSGDSSTASIPNAGSRS